MGPGFQPGNSGRRADDAVVDFRPAAVNRAVKKQAITRIDKLLPETEFQERLHLAPSRASGRGFASLEGDHCDRGSVTGGHAGRISTQPKTDKMQQYQHVTWLTRQSEANQSARKIPCQQGICREFDGIMAQPPQPDNSAAIAFE